jgi:hypothetical protein
MARRERLEAGKANQVDRTGGCARDAARGIGGTAA